MKKDFWFETSVDILLHKPNNLQKVSELIHRFNREEMGIGVESKRRRCQLCDVKDHFKVICLQRNNIGEWATTTNRKTSGATAEHSSTNSNSNNSSEWNKWYLPEMSAERRNRSTWACTCGVVRISCHRMWNEFDYTNKVTMPSSFDWVGQANSSNWWKRLCSEQD